MKKLLALTLLSGSIAILAPGVEAKTAGAAAVSDPQIRIQIGSNRNRNRRNWRRIRTRTFTRIVGFGRNRYRETIRVTYFPNGRTRTQVISRVRIGRRNY